jgi:ABC-type bacteriocin/lantibiotic exporter with double-glycine peptidase domain
MRSAARIVLVVAAISLAGSTGCRLAYKGGAVPVAAGELTTGWLHAHPTPVVVQAQQQDCGLAAIAMVAGAWGRHWTLDDLAHVLRPTDHGVKLGALRDLARERGLVAYAVRGRFEDLAHELGQGHPVLLGLVLPFDRKNNLAHYEVAVAYRPSDGTVVTRDPATGDLMKRSRQVLDLEWKQAGYATLVVVGDRPAQPGEPR